MFDPRIAVLALAVSGAGALGFGAWRTHAHGGFRGHGFGGPAMMHKFLDFAVNEKLDEIGANEAQKQKVLEIKDRLVKSVHAFRDGRGPLHDELLALVEKDNLEPGELKAAVHARAQEMVKLADEAAEAVSELHGVLTPEQRKQLLADAREHIARHRH